MRNKRTVYFPLLVVGIFLSACGESKPEAEIQKHRFSEMRKEMQAVDTQPASLSASEKDAMASFKMFYLRSAPKEDTAYFLDVQDFQKAHYHIFEIVEDLTSNTHSAGQNLNETLQQENLCMPQASNSELKGLALTTGDYSTRYRKDVSKDSGVDQNGELEHIQWDFSWSATYQLDQCRFLDPIRSRHLDKRPVPVHPEEPLAPTYFVVPETPPEEKARLEKLNQELESAYEEALAAYQKAYEEFLKAEQVYWSGFFEGSRSTTYLGEGQLRMSLELSSDALSSALGGPADPRQPQHTRSFQGELGIHWALDARISLSGFDPETKTLKQHRIRSENFEFMVLFKDEKFDLTRDLRSESPLDFIQAWKANLACKGDFWIDSRRYSCAEILAAWLEDPQSALLP